MQSLETFPCLKAVQDPTSAKNKAGEHTSRFSCNTESSPSDFGFTDRFCTSTTSTRPTSRLLAALAPPRLPSWCVTGSDQSGPPIPLGSLIGSKDWPLSQPEPTVSGSNGLLLCLQLSEVSYLWGRWIPSLTPLKPMWAGFPSSQGLACSPACFVLFLPIRLFL